MIYENIIKIYGPYLGKDGRYRIVLKKNNGTKQTISYPKYLMEVFLGRYLEANETVDHIDGNPLNNKLSNLRVLDRKEHCTNDCIRNNNIIVTCTYCGKTFEIKGSKLHNRNRLDRHQSGYFCSRSCSGKYGRKIQLGLREHIQQEKLVASKYKLHNNE